MKCVDFGQKFFSELALNQSSFEKIWLLSSWFIGIYTEIINNFLKLNQLYHYKNDTNIKYL